MTATAEYFQARRLALTSKGLCTRCQANLGPNRQGKRLCAECNTKQTVRRRLLKRARKEGV